MEATKQTLASIFNGHRIFNVPFYQRSYVWQKDEWVRFLEDMEFVTKQNKDYFLGSAILKQQSTNMGEANDHRTIIDGQQRFTTLAIFAKVLCMKSGEENEFTSHFMAKLRDKTRTYAIVHSLNDNNAFQRVMSMKIDEPIDEDKNSTIIKAYNFFQRNIDTEKLDIDTLLTRLIFITIELQPDDDEQAIFDTINSLGVRLTTAELLKNYFFTDSSKEEYETIWVPLFEKDSEVIDYWNTPVIAGRKTRSNIDAFFSAYLNVKIQDKSINIDNEHKMMYRRADSMFKSYKDLVNTYSQDKNDMLWDIMSHAELYFKNIKPDVMENDLPGAPCIERINFLIYTLDCTTMLPYILYILKNVGDKTERNKIFGYLESYIVRRAICQSANNSFSDLFAEILLGNEVDTFEKLRNIIENKAEQKLAFPSDAEVRRCLPTEKHPNKRGMAILYLMESRLRNGEKHATKLRPYTEYELEHLMPKKFEKNWPLYKNYSEEDRRQLIETLGNMSILPSKLNRSVSNAAWETKKKGKGSNYGLEYYASDLVTLKNVIQSPVWNEDTIKSRAMWLADIALKIWPSYLMEDDDYSMDEAAINTSMAAEPIPEVTKGRNAHQDKTKYSFDGINYQSKSAFVLQIVHKYMEHHPGITFAQLKKVFHDRLCASSYKFIGFLVKKEDYDKWDNKYKENRYRPSRPGGTLHSSDGVTFYVNTQWAQGEEFRKVLKLAEKEELVIYKKMTDI